MNYYGCEQKEYNEILNDRSYITKKNAEQPGLTVFRGDDKVLSSREVAHAAFRRVPERNQAVR